jgi:hypothetical protein
MAKPTAVCDTYPRAMPDERRPAEARASSQHTQTLPGNNRETVRNVMLVMGGQGSLEVNIHSSTWLVREAALDLVIHGHLALDVIVCAGKRNRACGCPGYYGELALDLWTSQCFWPASLTANSLPFHTDFAEQQRHRKSD